MTGKLLVIWHFIYGLCGGPAALQQHQQLVRSSITGFFWLSPKDGIASCGSSLKQWVEKVWEWIYIYIYN